MIMYTMMLTFLPNDQNLEKIFKIYILAFSVFGVWGIIAGGRIRSFLPLEDEDSFGPFMALGIAFS